MRLGLHHIIRFGEVLMQQLQGFIYFAVNGGLKQSQVFGMLIARAEHTACGQLAKAVGLVCEAVAKRQKPTRCALRQQATVKRAVQGLSLIHI
jgi:hypothetical protein